MKLLLLVLCAAVCAQAINIKWSRNDDVNYDVDEEWENFKKIHNRAFHTNGHEEKRKAIFASNLETIMNHNQKYERGLSSYKMGVNQFADLTSEEFENLMLSPMNSTESVSGSTFLPSMNVGDLPEEVDWVKKGYVTPVKIQGQCGSCWAFSTTGAIEGQHFRKTGKLVSLSEQNLVDCSRSFGNNGCHGGWMSQAFDFVKENSGIDTEESYPYEANEDDCRFNKASVGATVSGYVAIEEDSEEKLQEAIATVGPVSVAINARIYSIQFYHSGVHDNYRCNYQGLNHAVLAVGYGKENGKEYYLVKNSWGKTWGDKGYIKMARNKNNQCGIASKASYPLV